MVQSFAELENRREYLEDLGRRHERFPYALFEVAKEGESLHAKIKSGKQLVEKGANPDQVQVGYRSLTDMIDPTHGFVQAHLDEFDLSSYMRSLYDDSVRQGRPFPGVGRTDLEPIKVRGELEQRVQFLPHGQMFHEKSIRVLNEKPRYLREFSGRFMDVFGVLYVGNGFRHLGNYINFLNEGKGMVYEHDAFVLPREKESEFLSSINSVRYIGVRKLPTIPHNAKNWFFTNGWPSEVETYLLKFSDGKKPMVAYLERGIYGQAYGEGVLLIHNTKGEEVVTKSIDSENAKKKIPILDGGVLLSQLDTLQPGIAGEIGQLLNDRRFDYMQKITARLAELGFSTSEVHIELSRRRTPSIKQHFGDIVYDDMMADRLGL